MDNINFFKHVKWENGCIVWTGSTADGYGRYKHPATKQMTQAHRVAYQFVRGIIPDGMHLDHLCRNRRCVHPFHLDPVTNRENIIRGEGVAGVNSRKTHCHHGHELTPCNIYRRAGRRECLECKTTKDKVRAYVKAFTVCLALSILGGCASKPALNVGADGRGCMVGIVDHTDAAILRTKNPTVHAGDILFTPSCAEQVGIDLHNEIYELTR